MKNKQKQLKIKKKQKIKELEEHRKQVVKYNNKAESSTHSKQKEIFEELANKRMEEIQDLSK